MTVRIQLLAIVVAVAMLRIALAEESSQADDQSLTPSSRNQDGVVGIPLEKVWAFRMPGTIDVSKAVPSSHRRAVEQIRESLSQASLDRDRVFSALAVRGDYLAALDQVKRILVDGKELDASFRTSDQVWIVFFARTSPQYVYIDAVQRTANVFRVEYRFVPHEESVVTVHFALIPVGKLPLGKYQIDVTQAPLDPESIRLGFSPPASKIVKSVICQPSVFEIRD